MRTCNRARGGPYSREMSGIFFDLPSPRLLQRFRFFETRMRTFASSLLRWLRAPACDSRQVHFRPNEVEFPAASQSACKLFEWTRVVRAPRTVHRSMRSAHLTIGSNLGINMNSYSSGRRPRRSRGGARRRDNHERPSGKQEKAKPQKKTFWQRVVAFFGDGTGTKKTATATRNGTQPSRTP